MTTRLDSRIVNALLYFFLVFFLVSVVLPKDVFQAIKNVVHLRIIDLLRLALLFLAIRIALRVRDSRFSFRELEILPFLLLFLFSTYNLSKLQDYRWGADDSFYYSYVSSAILDRDLDFSNQYTLSGLNHLTDEKFLQRRTAAGFMENIFPVGLSLLWSPFFLAGHLIAHLCNLAGQTVAMDGYSKPYTHSVATGNLLYVCAGLYLCYRLACSFFSRWTSFVSTAAILFCTPPLFSFFKIFHLVSEPPSIFLIALFLLLVRTREKPWSIRFTFLLGVLAGLMTAVRFHNCIVLLLPLMLLYQRMRAGIRFRDQTLVHDSLRTAVVLGFAVLIGFLPQFIAWRILYGNWFLNIPGEFLPWWKSPFFLETLFSSRKGLFPWTPIVLLSLPWVFLFQKSDRKWAWTLWWLLFLTVYLNASQRDWWGSSAFGARRFAGWSVIFVIGLAAFYSRLIRWKRAVGHFCMIAVIVFLAGMTGSLSRSYFQMEEFDHAVRFSDAFDGGFSRVYRWVAYPLEFPVQLAYRMRYGIQMYGPWNEFFIGDDILYFQAKCPNLLGDCGNLIFGEGWKSEKGMRITTADIAVMRIPMFFKEKPNVEMEMRVEPERDVRDAWIEVSLNGVLLRSRRVPAQGGLILVQLTRREYLSKVNLIRLRMYRKSAPQLIPVVVLENLRFTGSS